MNKFFIYGVAVGALGVLLYQRYTAKVSTMDKKPQTTEEKLEEVKEVVVEEAKKYGDVLRKKFEILLPSDMVNKKVEQKAQAFTERRYAENPQNIKAPLLL